MRISNRYLTEFVMLHCAPDLLEHKLYPNPKEITESMGAFNAVRKYMMDKIGFGYRDSDVAIVCVGDGTTPRTGALFALRSAWTVYSIDPVLRQVRYPYKRVNLISSKVEDQVLDLSQFSNVVLVFVHSHADLELSVKHITAPRKHIVTIPCCVEHDWRGEPFLGYYDRSIWSEKRLVKIWFDVKG